MKRQLGILNTDIHTLFIERVSVRKWRTYVFADEADEDLKKGEKEDILQEVELVKV